MTGTKVGVTGAEGFMGTWLTGVLSAGGYALRKLDRSRESLFMPDSLQSFVRDSEVIIHLAGKNRAAESELYTANTAGTVGLLRAIEEFGSMETLVIFASSTQVYSPVPTATPIGEEWKKNYESPFSRSKLLAEASLLEWAKAGSLRAASLRFSNVYGYGARPNYNSVIANFIEAARRGKPLEVVGGEQTRDFIYVEDAIRAIASVINYKFSGFEAFNVCTGIPTTILDLAKAVTELIPGTIKQKKVPDSKPGHLVGDPTRLVNATGFRARTNLDSGLRMTLAKRH